MAEAERADTCEVWPECWEAVSFFVALETQWRWVSGMAVARVGLDYTAVEALMRLRAVPRASRAELLEDLRVMERAALAVWSERARRESRAPRR